MGISCSIGAFFQKLAEFRRPAWCGVPDRNPRKHREPLPGIDPFPERTFDTARYGIDLRLAVYT
ncbi:hypothetical protein MHZ35_11245 [Sphingomonas sp. ACRSK]|nr:hypothetical protein [Sphingomonas sp. ACRSK]